MTLILYNSISINKKVKLSDLDFRQNIDCFCSILLTKIVPIKATAELLCVSEQHSVSLLNESTFLSESMIQWPIYNDSASFLNESAIWMNQLNEWINDSLIKTDTCRHLLVI